MDHTDEQMISLFVSYARDDRQRALVVINALEQAGYDVWWDGLLEGGANFLTTTETALESAQAVIVLWSKTSIASHWVRDEATRGRDRGCLIPISLDGSDAPLGFRQFQLINLAAWRGKSETPEFQSVVRAVERCSGTSASPLPKTVPRPALSRRFVIGGGIGVAAAGAALAAWRLDLFDSAASANSLAVLPFRNLSGDSGQDYFADGLSEELRSTLSLNRQLNVVAQMSSSSFRTDEVMPNRIASALGVARILQGSVRRSAGMLRITAQLIDGKTGFENWSQAFDRKEGDVLIVQSEIATAVVDSMIAAMDKDQDWRAERPGGTRIAPAFDAYVHGQALYQSASSEATDREALAAFDQAIARDPAYAAAYAARARSLTFIANSYAGGEGVTEVRARGFASARKAIALAPNMAEGHAALGFILMGRLDMKLAQAPYRKSLDLGFGNATILTGFAEFAANYGDFPAAREAIARAKRLDPLNPSVFRSAGIVEFSARDYDAAAKPLEAALSLNAKTGTAHRILGDIALLKGDNAAALAHYQKEPSKLAKLRSLAVVAPLLSGPAAGARALATLVEQFGDDSLYQQALVLAQWGRKEDALTTLEKAFAIGDAGLVLARNDPLLDPIRQDPRFASILTRIGFENA